MKIKEFNLIIVVIFNLVLIFQPYQVYGSNFSEPIIADHSIMNVIRYDQIPDSIITTTKNTLHIAYQHTSHGSQITDGMSALPSFKEGLGGTLNLYDFNSSFLHDYAMPSVPDVGYEGWADATRDYLDNPENADCNVIMWSWCGQASSQTEQSMIDHYLTPMAQLEQEYPNVMFVYMTGHVDGTGLDGNLHQRNEQIREFCISGNRILFDFADIESYDPDGIYYGDKNVNDDCSWDDGINSGNWALEWQASHTEGVDWFSCSCAHSQALNGNQKAYAIWWLWAKLSGWETTITESLSSISFVVFLVLSFISIVSKQTQIKKQ